MIIESIVKPVLNPGGVILFFIIPAVCKLIGNMFKADKQFPSFGYYESEFSCGSFFNVI